MTLVKERNSVNVLNHRLALQSARIFGKAKWIPKRFRRSLLKWMYPISRAPAESFNIIFRKHTIDVYLQDFIDNRIFFYNEYETAELNFINFAAREHGAELAVDIGANSGIHTLEMSRSFKSVIAFEPYPKVRKKLERRLRQNSIQHVSVHGFALGLEDELLDYYVDTESSNSGMGSFDRNHDPLSTVLDAFEVKMGDAVLVSQQKIDLVKIDVEGWEPQVILGLRKTVERSRPVIMFEVTPSSLANTLFNEAVTFLKNSEYVFYLLRTPRSIFSKGFEMIEVTEFSPKSGGSNYVAISTH